MNDKANKDEQYWRDQYERRIQFNDAVDRAVAALAKYKDALNAPAPQPHMLAYSDMSKDDLLHAIKNELDRETKILEDLVVSCAQGHCVQHRERDVGKLIACQSISTWLHNVEKEHIRAKV